MLEVFIHFLTEYLLDDPHLSGVELYHPQSIIRLKVPVIAPNMHHSHLFYPWEVDNSSSTTKQRPGLCKELISLEPYPSLGLVGLN